MLYPLSYGGDATFAQLGHVTGRWIAQLQVPAARFGARSAQC